MVLLISAVCLFLFMGLYLLSRFEPFSSYSCTIMFLSLLFTNELIEGWRPETIPSANGPYSKLDEEYYCIESSVWWLRRHDKCLLSGDRGSIGESHSGKALGSNLPARRAEHATNADSRTIS